jgi:histidinol-phosphatase (PHP family)
MSSVIPHDYHLHSAFSGDNRTPMEAQCRAAIDRGIPEICFTEHFDVHPAEPMRFVFPLEAWAAELERCRKAFDGRLVIRAGLEAGEPHLAEDHLLRLLERYPFDLVIGSLHWVGDRIVFAKNYFDRPADDAYTAYFTELERMTKIGGFDVLGHLDIVARLGWEIYRAYDPGRYEPLIRRTLDNCIAKGIALDVNAACLRREMDTTNPHPAVLRWYVEMGGRRVIFSSDAHEPGHVGLHLERAIDLARRAGITHFAAFERRRSRLVVLPA